MKQKGKDEMTELQFIVRAKRAIIYYTTENIWYNYLREDENTEKYIKVFQCWFEKKLKTSEIAIEIKRSVHTTYIYKRRIRRMLGHWESLRNYWNSNLSGVLEKSDFGNDESETSIE